MPNWVSTIVEFDGDESDITEVFKEIGNDLSDNGDQRIFDFNKLISMPESLNLTSGSESELALAYYEAKKLGRLSEHALHKDIEQVLSRVEKDINISSQKMMELGKQLYENIEKYGAKGYDWYVRRWGTTRNACECFRNNNMLSFYTAWSWPKPIMIKLAKICTKHNVEFEGKWADEDMGNNTGYFYCDREDGCLDCDYYGSGSSEAYKAYIDCWGKSTCIGVDDNGVYYHYECGENCPNCEECCYI